MMKAPMKGQGTISRGRLRSVTLKNNYDQDGAPAGHTVSPDYDADDSGMMSMSPQVSSSHETHDGAMAKMQELHQDNMKKFKKKAAPKMDEGAMRMAMGRKR